MTKEEYIGRKAPRWHIVLLRLYMGYYFIQAAVLRIQSGDWRGDELAEHYEKLKDALVALPWFRTYLETVIDKIQANELFPLLMTAAPLLLGLSLALGLWTRLSTLLGIVYVLHLYFINFGSALGTMMFYQMQMAVLAVLFLSASGRTLGIDGLFWRNRISQRFEPVPPKGAEGRVQRVAPEPPLSIPLSGEESRSEEKPDEEKDEDRPDSSTPRYGNPGFRL